MWLSLSRGIPPNLLMAMSQAAAAYPSGNMGGNVGIMGLYRDNGKENGNYI